MNRLGIQRVFIVLLAGLSCCAAALAAVPSAQSVPPGEEVSFTASDGVKLSGLFHPPATGKTTLILLHGLGSTQSEWLPFAARLADEGFGFLTYDARGHGKSPVTAGGRNYDYRSFGNPRPGSHWTKMTGDLETAVRFLKQSKNLSRIGVMGASLGANVCIVYGAGDPDIDIVAALSPGIEYAGVRTDTVIASYGGRALVLAAAPDDPYAFQSAEFLYRKVKANGRAVFLQGPSGHGVNMLNGAFTRDLLRAIGTAP